GVRDVLDRAREKRQLLPFDRAALRAIPVPTRFENYTELRLAREWKTVFAKEFDEYYREWLPATTTAREALEKLFLPYVPFWSFGERLPVVYEGASDPRSLGSAYSFVSRLLNHHLDWDATTRNFGAAAESRNAAAIAAEAEQIYVELADADRIGAKRLFLRLVWTNPSSDQVISAGEVPTRMLGLVSETVLAKYRDAGIIEVQSQEEREDLVELAVPEIIESWARLSRWIDADRELLRWRQSISPHVQVFATKDKPSRSDYLSGATLARAKELATKPHLINPIEKRLVSKSVERAARGELQRLAAAGITLTLAVGLAVTTISQRRLQQERLEAEQSLRVTQAFLRQQIEVSTESLQVNQQRLQALTDSLEAFRTRSRTSTATR
ncbi:MAG TPA: hypothetical protein VFS20_28055, partial [Longimicrobium sp.]|nr:hypothetical protein [Longimicrobium sp.]